MQPKVPSFERIVQYQRQLSLLKELTMFKNLSPEAIADLARRMTLRRFTAGSTVCAASEVVGAFQLVFEGQAKVVLYGPNGREITLARLERGDFFGEVSLMDGKPSSAHVVAVGDLAVLVLAREAFLSFLTTVPQAAFSLMGAMADRLRRADQLIGNLALHDVSDRLLRTLVALAEEDGENSDDGLTIRRRPTQQDLANMVGTCRETVSRALGAMARQGLVFSKGRTLVLKPALLQQLAQAA